MPRSACGPRLSAALATLAVRNRISRRDTVELAGELFGARISSGAVDAILRRTATALSGPYEDLLCHIHAAPVLNIEETGWRLRGSRRTLWRALTSRAAVFRIAESRHEREARALLGEAFAGVACSDRWWAYDYLEPQRRQFCWSHLVRDFRAHSEGLGAQKQFGEARLEIADQLFAAWDLYRAEGDRGSLAERIAPLKEELRRLLEEAARTAPAPLLVRRTRRYARRYARRRALPIQWRPEVEYRRIRGAPSRCPSLGLVQSLAVGSAARVAMGGVVASLRAEGVPGKQAARAPV